MTLFLRYMGGHGYGQFGGRPFFIAAVQLSHLRSVLPNSMNKNFAITTLLVPRLMLCPVLFRFLRRCHCWGRILRWSAQWPLWGNLWSVKARASLTLPLIDKRIDNSKHAPGNGTRHAVSAQRQVSYAPRWVSPRIMVSPQLSSGHILRE